MKRSIIYLSLLFAALGLFSFSHAQVPDTDRNDWLLGVIFKLETMKEKAAAEILKYQNEIAKCDNRINSSEKILKMARQAGNSQAEAVAIEAIKKARDARVQNMKNAISAALNKKRAEKALAYIKTGGKNRLSLKVSTANGKGNKTSLLSSASWRRTETPTQSVVRLNRTYHHCSARILRTCSPETLCFLRKTAAHPSCLPHLTMI